MKKPALVPAAGLPGPAMAQNETAMARIARLVILLAFPVVVLWLPGRL
jgi:hypothetical protein